MQQGNGGGDFIRHLFDQMKRVKHVWHAALVELLPVRLKAELPCLFRLRRVNHPSSHSLSRTACEIILVCFSFVVNLFRLNPHPNNYHTFFRKSRLQTAQAVFGLAVKLLIVPSGKSCRL